MIFRGIPEVLHNFGYDQINNYTEICIQIYQVKSRKLYWFFLVSIPKAYEIPAFKLILSMSIFVYRHFRSHTKEHKNKWKSQDAIIMPQIEPSYCVIWWKCGRATIGFLQGCMGYLFSLFSDLSWHCGMLLHFSEIPSFWSSRKSKVQNFSNS